MPRETSAAASLVFRNREEDLFEASALAKKLDRLVVAGARGENRCNEIHTRVELTGHVGVVHDDVLT